MLRSDDTLMERMADGLDTVSKHHIIIILYHHIIIIINSDGENGRWS